MYPIGPNWRRSVSEKHSKSPNSRRSNYLCCLFKLRPDLFRFVQSFGDLGSPPGCPLRLSTHTDLRIETCGWWIWEIFGWPPLLSASLRSAPTNQKSSKSTIRKPRFKPAWVERLRSQTLRAGQTPKDPAKTEKIRTPLGQTAKILIIRLLPSPQNP